MDRRSSLSREEKVERGREDDRRTLKRGSTRLARRDEGTGDRGCVCAPNNTREDEGWGKKLGMGLAIYIGRARKGKGRSGGKGIPRAVLCCRCRDGFVPCERSEEAERTWKPPWRWRWRWSGTLERGPQRCGCRCRAKVRTSLGRDVGFAWLGAGGSLVGVR